MRPVAAGDGLGQRGLADARRADEAEDRPLELLHQRLHGEVLEDALLDLLQAVVVLVEDPARPRLMSSLSLVYSPQGSERIQSM